MAEKKLRRPVAEVRAELLADPRMASMAQTLNLTTEAYVELVLDYAQHPEKTPTFQILPDAEVKARGGSTVQDVQNWFKKVIKGEIQIGPKGFHDGFDAGPADPNKKLSK